MKKSILPVYNYQVYVDVFNTAIWSNFKNDYVASVTIFSDSNLEELLIKN